MIGSENREVTASFNTTPENGAVAWFNRYGMSECAAALEFAKEQWLRTLSEALEDAASRTKPWHHDE